MSKHFYHKHVKDVSNRVDLTLHLLSIVDIINTDVISTGRTTNHPTCERRKATNLLVNT